MHNDYVHESQIHLHHKTIHRGESQLKCRMLSVGKNIFGTHLIYYCYVGTFMWELFEWKQVFGIKFRESVRHTRSPGTQSFFVLFSLSAFSRSLVVSLAVMYYGIYGRVVGRLLSARGDASKVLIFRIFWHYTRLWAWLYHTECNNPFAKFFLSRSFFMLIVLFTLLSYLVRFQNESPIFVCFIFFFFVFVSSCYILSPLFLVHGSFDDPAEFICMRASFIFFSFLLKCNFIFRSTSWNVLNREIEKLLYLPHTEQFKYVYSNRNKCLINTHGEGCSMLRQTT